MDLADKKLMELPNFQVYAFTSEESDGRICLTTGPSQSMNPC